MLVEKAMKSEKYNRCLDRREADDPIDVPVRVATRSYREFSRWMDRELAKLVARWAHTAAPNAARSPRFRFRKPKPR